MQTPQLRTPASITRQSNYKPESVSEWHLQRRFRLFRMNSTPLGWMKRGKNWMTSLRTFSLVNSKYFCVHPTPSFQSIFASTPPPTHHSILNLFKLQTLALGVITDYNSKTLFCFCLSAAFLLLLFRHHPLVDLVLPL